MGRPDPTWLIALAASLLLHGVLLAAGAYLPSAPARGQVPSGVAPATPIFVPEVPESPNRLGHALGSGDAASASEGDLPLEARHAPQNQAFLSLDPAGPGRVGDPPSESLLPVTPKQPLDVLDRQPERHALAVAGFGLPPGATEIGRPLLPMRPAPLLKFAEAGPVPEQPDEPSPAVETGAASAADPAPQGLSESDPFSKTGSVRFRGGRMEVQLGRDYRLVPRPRIGLAGQVDLFTEGPVRVVLQLHIDATGKVAHVKVVHSGGTNEIDQPCVVAAYQWWFEPTKDAAGNPVPDVILFTLTWH